MVDGPQDPKRPKTSAAPPVSNGLNLNSFLEGVTQKMAREFAEAPAAP